ncbi:MAG: hypothetical protein ACYTDT_11640 [Planctomycetota bacterium]|jgi:hypothetical protein
MENEKTIKDEIAGTAGGEVVAAVCGEAIDGVVEVASKTTLAALLESLLDVIDIP